jgi:hypothetical protein
MMKLKAFLIGDWWWVHYLRPSDNIWVPFYRAGRKGDCIRF